jgi:hypothetical protein
VLPPPLMAEDGSHSLGLSSGSCEVHRQDPLCVECGLVLVRPIQLGRSDHLLTGKLASLLHFLALDVILLSVGSRSLPLPKVVLSLRREPGV